MDLSTIFASIEYQQVPLLQVFIRFIVACFSGLVIAAVYKLYHLNDRSSSDMLHSLIFISLIICCAMMIIGNNLASAFGLVGAVSIIRFRTSVKNARDMSFVFFSVVTGMSCGLGFIRISIVGLGFIVLVMISVYFLHWRKLCSESSLLVRVSYKGIVANRSAVESILSDKSCSSKFKSMKIDDNRIICSYLISLKNNDSIDQIVKSLEGNDELNKVKVYFSSMEN